MVIAISNADSNAQTLSNDLSQLMKKLKGTGRFIFSIIKGCFRVMLVPCDVQTKVDEARTAAMMRGHL